MANRKKPNWAYHIYALIDPRDMLVYYVGMSKNAYTRLSTHLVGNCGAQEHRWLSKLQKEGLSPILEVLETIEDSRNASTIVCEREQYWIREMARLGHPLLNTWGLKYRYPSPPKFSRVLISEKADIPIYSKQSVARGQKPKADRQRPVMNEQVLTAQAPMSEKETLTIRDVVIEMSVNEKTVRCWIQNGELHATKDIFGRYQIQRNDLNEFIRKRTEKYNTSSEE